MQLSRQELALHFLHVEVLLRELPMVEQKLRQLLFGCSSPCELGLRIVKASPRKPGE